MRGVRKGDWFSVVATDLFCGALCAVIILDAVSPRGTVLTEGPQQFRMSFTRPAGSRCVDYLLAVKAVSSERTEIITTREAGIFGTECVTSFDVSEAEDLHFESVLLARGSTDIDVDISDEGGSGHSAHCSSGQRKCF
jgi:hypothetical protein